MVFVVGHAVWSISIPIAVVESLVPGRRTTPWLGNPGLAVTGAVFALGSWIILQDHRQTEQFATAPAQLAGSLAVTAALVALARPVVGLVLEHGFFGHDSLDGTAVSDRIRRHSQVLKIEPEAIVPGVVERAAPDGRH